MANSPTKNTTPRARSHTASTSSAASSLALTINTSPRGLQTPRSSASGASPLSFSLTSPRRGKQKPPPTHLLWISMVLLLGILNVVYQWGNADHDVAMLLNTEKDQDDDEGVLEFPFEPPKPSSAVVFYHIYLPPTPEGRDNSARIIEEQLQQLQDSQQSLTIYYNTIGGETDQLNYSHIQKLCQTHSMTCHHMLHYDSGMEDKTLQRLHNFCTINTEDYSIIYLHNKGSFSTKPLNEAWRYQMTQSVVSPQCQSATANDSCNLCGLWFSAERGMFIAGNMWRTKCSYVKQLMAPNQFQSAMHEVTAEAMMERLRYKLLMTMQEIRAGVFGIDRYATEFWIASHPTVKPCDFSKAIAPLPKGKTDLTDHFLGWLRRMGKNYQLPLQPEWFAEKAPHHPLPLPDHFPVSQHPDVRLREYFLMAGSLFRWNFLYHQTPPLDSWVYEWFPDGDTWREAVQKHGNEAVNVVTAEGLKQEVASGRNRYTADHSKKLTSNAVKGAAKKVGSAKKGGSAKTAKVASAKQAGGPKGLKKRQ